MFKLNFPTAAMTAAHLGSVLEFVFSGVVSRATVEAGLLQWQCLTTRHEEAAYVLRLDKALWVSGCETDFLSLMPESGPFLTRPSVIVVHAENEAWFKRLALYLALSGVVLGVFTCAGEASAWVLRRALAFSPSMAPRQTQSLAGSEHKHAAAGLHLSSHQAIELRP